MEILISIPLWKSCLWISQCLRPTNTTFIPKIVARLHTSEIVANYGSAIDKSSYVSFDIEEASIFVNEQSVSRPQEPW